MEVQTNEFSRQGPFNQTLRTISFKQIDFTYKRSCVPLYKLFRRSLKSASRNCSTRESHLHHVTTNPVYNSRLLPHPVYWKNLVNHETNHSIVLEGNRTDASRQFLTQDIHFRSISLAKIEEDSLSMRRDVTFAEFLLNQRSSTSILLDPSPRAVSRRSFSIHSVHSRSSTTPLPRSLSTKLKFA